MEMEQSSSLQELSTVLTAKLHFMNSADTGADTEGEINQWKSCSLWSPQGSGRSLCETPKDRKSRFKISSSVFINV